jgi:CRISPR system Cascade subunit CasA
VAYNLLDESWIPVRRASGRADWIRPDQIAETEDPPVALASPRSDFDGALIQFLVALLQTASAPADESAWRGRIRPPSSAVLRSEFQPFRSAFELLGDGPRFMQDLTLSSEAPPLVNVRNLALDAPGEQTLGQNADVFVRRPAAEGVGLPAAAMLLLTLQLNASGGGAGFRTSLRGGGPLTTVLAGPSLWLTVWSNVLPVGVFEQRGGDPGLTADGEKFPWMVRCRTSEQGAITGTEQVHPLHQYWATPWRLRLIDPERAGRCQWTGLEGPLVQAVARSNYGYNYKGAFEHPLTPYRHGKPGQPPTACKLSTEGLPYRDWPAYLVGSERVEPARLVQHAQAHRRAREVRAATGTEVRLEAFGYSMDNAKAEAWFSSSAPIIEPPARDALFRRRLGVAVAIAEHVLFRLRSAVLDATKRRADDVKDKSDNSLSANLARRFWSLTEPDFMLLVGDLRGVCDADTGADEGALESRLEAWIVTLGRAARNLFEDFSQERGDFAACDVERVSVAWLRLVAETSVNDRKLRELGGLPSIEEAKPKRRAKGGANG